VVSRNRVPNRVPKWAILTSENRAEPQGRLANRAEPDLQGAIPKPKVAGSRPVVRFGQPRYGGGAVQ